MLWEAAAALLVGAAVLWLVIGPLLQPDQVRLAPAEPEDPLETPRGQRLAALKELDFDRAMGRISDADYAALRAAYTAEALAALRDEAELAAGAGEPMAAGEPTAPGEPADAREPVDAAEALIAARLEARVAAVEGTTAAACPRCGPRPEPDARFCSECGGGVAAASCQGCGAKLHPGGRFCDQCGAAAAA